MTAYKDLSLRERARRNPVTIGLFVLILSIVLIKLFSGEAYPQEQHGYADEAVLHVRVDHVANDQDDFDKAFRRGVIDLPVGTVFEVAGPAFGLASNPRDIEHVHQPLGWIGLSEAETSRRDAWLAQALNTDAKRKAGLITLLQIEPLATAILRGHSSRSRALFGKSLDGVPGQRIAGRLFSSCRTIRGGT